FERSLPQEREEAARAASSEVDVARGGACRSGAHLWRGGGASLALGPIAHLLDLLLGGLGQGRDIACGPHDVVGVHLTLAVGEGGEHGIGHDTGYFRAREPVACRG